ncbi:thiamine biosynthesis protein [Agromyces badenianii]|uniref:Thiamine pyrimidine synthase n=1 Tax=Agromyces badenianii TaxID=2080742 RepID=A0A2S0WU95_9MICO|nr:ABC transporter substrate-binding protein [Agromyces badenianii]AWB94814.1 thiamine biosynthesis protein [Agromyces badenianii]PWC03389.1 thiamine biosynthesis protein [Agromyces badenianii]
MSYRKCFAALSIPLVLGLAACSSEAPAPAESSSFEGERESVRYLTGFNTFGRDAYVYVAEELGYFDEVGIDITIEPGSGSVDVMKLIASGSADFGPVDFSAAVVTVANEDLPVTAVAAIQQRTLAAIVTLEGYGIESPKDLEGKTIADQPGSTNEVIFPAYAEKAGIDASTVSHVPAAPPTLPQVLATHQADAIGQFVVGEPLIASVAQGRDVVVLPYGDELPDLYGTVLMTSDEIATTNPELVERFRTALLKGLEYSIEHPEESGEILKKYHPTQDAKAAAAEIELMAPFVPGEGELGSMDPARVDVVIETLSAAITGDVTAEELVSFDLLPGAGS